MSHAPEAFCDFAQWSYIESVPLNGDLESDTRQVCLDIYAKRAELRSNFYKDSANAITTHALREHMNNTFSRYSQQFKDGTKTKEVYNMLWTDTSIMEDLGTVMSNMTEFGGLQPSSTILLELTERTINDEKKLYVAMNINDKPAVMTQCSTAESTEPLFECEIDQFLTKLNETLQVDGKPFNSYDWCQGSKEEL